MSFNLTELGNQLQEASEKTEGTGVSFAGKSLKLNTEEDAREVVEAIEKCKRLEYLDLEGNTLGPDAAKAIATALEKHGANLKRALWKDMFTGRVKTEIPLALEYLGTGLRNAGTQLVELDLSDNAFGPIGVQGLAAFLSSSTCYTLKQLRLNNNGLGISGGKMLAKALLDCYSNSLRDGQGSRQLALKVFVAGRNRLENEGAEALAAVFRQLTSLEEVVMPQNGIYHVGVAALASGLSENPGLRILNLNDNTVGPKGAAALAKVLPNFRFLESLNLGDCLLKTKGAVVLAESLGIKGNHPCLSELNLTFNEIGTRGADPIAQAMSDKSQLTSLQLDGNIFGAKGRDVLRDALSASDRISTLGTFDEDESESEGENEDGENESSENEDEESQDSENDREKDEEETEKAEVKKTEKQKRITVEDFMKSSTGENLLLLQGDSLSSKVQSFIQQAKNLSKAENKYEGDKYAEELTRIIMKVSTLCGSGYGDVRVEAERLSDALYAELFSYAVKNNQVSNLNNSLLINLGLMKREEKNVRKIDWNLEGCFKALEKVSQREYFLSGTRDTLKLFIEKPPRTSRVKVIDPCQEAKASLKAILDRLQTT